MEMDARQYARIERGGLFWKLLADGGAMLPPELAACFLRKGSLCDGELRSLN